MTTTDPTAAEITALRERLAEAREHWRQVADALARAETERDQALAEIARVRRQVLAVADDLERYAADLRPEKLPISHRKLAVALREIVVGEADRAQALAATAPETAPKSPHSQDHTQVRGDSRTEASAGSDGPWSDAWCRTQLQRLSIAASEQYGLRWRDYDVVGAVIAEIDRLRTEAKRLSARVREWEAVNADLAARCDSGDIPIRLGERYSQAVLREIDRLRTERDRLMDELPEDNTIVAAIRRLRALGSTPDTGSTT